jgi:hypothetical protein
MEPTETLQIKESTGWGWIVLVVVLLSALFGFTFISGSWYGRLNNQCIVSSKGGI